MKNRDLTKNIPTRLNSRRNNLIVLFPCFVILIVQGTEFREAYLILKIKQLKRENVYEIWIEAFILIKKRNRDFVLSF